MVLKKATHFALPHRSKHSRAASTQVSAKVDPSYIGNVDFEVIRALFLLQPRRAILRPTSVPPDTAIIVKRVGQP